MISCRRSDLPMFSIPVPDLAKVSALQVMLQPFFNYTRENPLCVVSGVTFKNFFPHHSLQALVHNLHEL